MDIYNLHFISINQDVLGVFELQEYQVRLPLLVVSRSGCSILVIRCKFSNMCNTMFMSFLDSCILEH